MKIRDKIEFNPQTILRREYMKVVVPLNKANQSDKIKSYNSKKKISAGFAHGDPPLPRNNHLNVRHNLRKLV